MHQAPELHGQGKCCPIDAIQQQSVSEQMALAQALWTQGYQMYAGQDIPRDPM